MRNLLPSRGGDLVESLPDGCYSRCDMEVPSNLESLRSRLGSILVGSGIISFLNPCAETKRESHLKGSSPGRSRKESDRSEVSPLNLSLIPLRQASLCLDCETITTARTDCHACGSRALLNVARALDRQRPSDLVCSRKNTIRQPDISCQDTLNLGRRRPNMHPVKLDFIAPENNV